MTTEMNGHTTYNTTIANGIQDNTPGQEPSTPEPYVERPAVESGYAGSGYVETNTRRQLPSDSSQHSDLSQLIQDQFGKLQNQFMEMFEQAKSSDQWRAVENNPKARQFLQEVDGDEVKRWSFLLGGGFLALHGARRSMGSLTLMGIGAGLVYYALTGRRPLADLYKEKGEGKGLFDTSLAGKGVGTTQSIIVNAKLEDIFDAWANFENFPHFMQNIKSVVKTGDNTSHWIMEGPVNTTFEWDAQTTRMEENKRIAWNSIRGDIKTSGQVTFNPLPENEVEVTVMLKYVPPAGLAGEVAAALFSNPEEKLYEDLRNFKRHMEHAG